jgi:hypothetical protein
MSICLICVAPSSVAVCSDAPVSSDVALAGVFSLLVQLNNVTDASNNNIFFIIRLYVYFLFANIMICLL